MRCSRRFGNVYQRASLVCIFFFFTPLLIKDVPGNIVVRKLNSFNKFLCLFFKFAAFGICYNIVLFWTNTPLTAVKCYIQLPLTLE